MQHLAAALPVSGNIVPFVTVLPMWQDGHEGESLGAKEMGPRCESCTAE
jgi:hypothetical protein